MRAVVPSRKRGSISGVAAFAALAAIVGLVACGDDPGPLTSVAVVERGQASLTVVYPLSSGAGVKEAADFVVSTLGTMTGVTFPAARAVPAGTGLGTLPGGAVLVLGRAVLDREPVDAAAAAGLTAEGAYVIRAAELDGRSVVQVAGKDEAGVQYGAYDLLRRNGVRFWHPADTHVPALAGGALSVGPPEAQKPGFALRGFHHHTQHPIPMSVYLLEPDDKHLDPVRQVLRWLVRNRQNVLEWHMLKTVDMSKWVSHVQKIRAMARPYGIKLGVYLSFADQQQNNHRLITDTSASKAQQDAAIKAGLDPFVKAGLDIVGFQFGTSEFTKVSDATALGWLATGCGYLKTKGIPCYAWIHTSGDVHADDGKSYFYHLPEKSGSEVGAYVHTTMFYDLKNAAPVYGNTSFKHQREFLERNLGKRDIVYFPETAWWLGFDINLPMALPITGHSRAVDVLEVLAGKDVQGHVTFTSGREWGYWRYDHYLTRVTWDRKTTWDAYLAEFAALFGTASGAVKEVLGEWTRLQVRDFYGKNPEILFYLTGELPLDEVAHTFGIVARRPKRPFSEIIDLTDAALATWKGAELDKLATMLAEYEPLLTKLPAAAPSGSSKLVQKLFLELRTTLELSVWRVRHTHLLYDAVRLGRGGREDGGVGAAADAATRKKAQTDALLRVKEAEAITAKVKTAVARMEKEVYRYPLSVLATKRASLTSYAYGYLWETREAYFWSRRDEQATALLKRAFGQVQETWGTLAPAAVFEAKASDVSVTQPDSSLVRQVLGAFVPGILVGASGSSVPDGALIVPWSVGLDSNGNGKPDAGTVSVADSATVSGGSYLGSHALIQLPVVDKTGTQAGVLGLKGVTLKLKLKRGTGDLLQGVESGTLEGRVILSSLVTVAMKLGGIDRAGLLALLATVLKFDVQNPPPDFPVTITLAKLSKQ